MGARPDVGRGILISGGEGERGGEALPCEAEDDHHVDALTEDEAARLSLDDIILVIDGQHPACVKRIKYYEDATLRPLFEGQTGDHPLPLSGTPNAQDAAALDARVAAMVRSQTASLIAAQRVGPGSGAASSVDTPTPPASRKRPRASSSLLAGLLNISDV